MRNVTLDELISLLEDMPQEVVTARSYGLAESGRIVAAEARQMLGTYQNGGGEIPAWRPLAETTKAERAELGFAPDDPELRTTRLRAAIESAVDSAAGVVAVGVESRIVGEGTRADPRRDIGEVAVAQEMGIGVPKRSFLGLAMYRRAHEAVNLTALRVVMVLAGKGV